MRIAIVEDEVPERALLMELLRRYEQERNVKFAIAEFGDGDELTRDYRAAFDLILMDIEMAFQDGMSAAREIRQVDEEVSILFITNAPQYVMKGYEVGALDYLLKPVGYFALSKRLDRAMKRLDRRKQAFVKLNVKGGFQKVETRRVRFVETDNREAVYHTLDGDFRTRDTIQGAEALLDSPAFFRCNKCYLVNLEYIDGIVGGDIRMGNDTIQVSRARKKPLLDAMNRYFSEKN